VQQRLTVLVAALTLVSASASAQERKFVPLDLSSKANQKLTDKLHTGVDGNDLKELAVGEHTFAEIKFRIAEGLVQLGSKVLETMPGKVEGIPVGRKFAQLHLFHATGFGGGPNVPGTPWHVEDGTLIGEYHVRYDDNSTESVAIVYGEDVRDWFYLPDEKEPSRGKVAWRGANDRAAQVGAKLRLYVSSWKNPKPGQQVVSIDYVSKKTETVAAPFCLAITLEE
jgi:hypothetical protein